MFPNCVRRIQKFKQGVLLSAKSVVDIYDFRKLAAAFGRGYFVFFSIFCALSYSPATPFCSSGTICRFTGIIFLQHPKKGRGRLNAYFGQEERSFVFVSQIGPAV